MDTFLHNIDDEAYRALEERAIAQGKRVEDLVNQAMQTYLRLPYSLQKRGSLKDMPIEDLGPGTEHLSEEIDSVLYGD